jgi:hypothetical protein
MHYPTSTTSAAVDAATDYARLLFRRQFILGPRFIDAFPAWQRVTVGRDLYLQAHLDLELTQVRRADTELTLLGYMLDPFRETAWYGGRWALIVDDGQETILFNDPSGLRSVVYTDSSYSERWCATQPELLRECLGLRVDEEAEREFIRSEYYEGSEQAWWPGDATPYREVKHLLPNHYLDLRRRCVHRFWPWEERGRLSLEEGVERGAEILRGIVTSAGRRFPVAVAITGGYDSRVVLAASREVSNDARYITYTWHRRHTREISDIQIPARLLPKLGLEHHVFDSVATVKPHDPDFKAFKDIYLRNVTSAHAVWAHVTYSLYKRGFDDRVVIKGHGSEIARVYWDSYGFPEDKIDGRVLAWKAKMPGNEFAIKHMNAWLPGARAATRYGYGLLDLFYWEQRVARWMASDHAEQDIVHETLAAFNCRELLTTLMAVPEKYRKPRNNRILVELARCLWSDVLSVPIRSGARSLKDEIRQRLQFISIRLGLSDIKKLSLACLCSRGVEALAEGFHMAVPLLA